MKPRPPLRNWQFPAAASSPPRVHRTASLPLPHFSAPIFLPSPVYAFVAFSAAMASDNNPSASLRGTAPTSRFSC